MECFERGAPFFNKRHDSENLLFIAFIYTEQDFFSNKSGSKP